MEGYPNRVIVVCGGESPEREISLKSGQAVYGALVRLGYDAMLFDLVREDEDWVCEHLLTLPCDCYFIALHGGMGEDGRLQAILEKKAFCYTGPEARGCAIAMDKLKTKQRLIENGVPTPEAVWLDASETLPEVPWGFPVVVKPADSGSSCGLTVAHNSDDVSEGIRRAGQISRRVMVERFVKGRELTVGILDGQALPIVEIEAPKGVYDYDAKYNSQETHYLVPARLDKDVARWCQECALNAADAVGCLALCRVDIILADVPYVLEVNAVPGMTERSLLPKAAQAAGISFDSMCKRLVQSSFEYVKG